MSKILHNFTVIDLSHRLPGPLCGKILADLGARIIKIEDHKFKDPFIAGLFSDFDNSFKNWYHNLNSNKEILRLDFNNHEDTKKIHELIHDADALIMGLPAKTRSKLKLEDEHLNFKKPFVVIELLASRINAKSMHDLNALAHSGLLKLFVAEQTASIVKPPFLPFAGISFGHKGATDLLASYIESTNKNETVFQKTYLDEVTNDLLGIFWPEDDRKNQRTNFLHNGAFPCYTIYQTRDKQYVALAAVEEKFWEKFCEIFKITTKRSRFYRETNELFELIHKSISSYELAEIEKLVEFEDICLSPIR